MTPRRWLAVALAGVALLLVAGRVGAALYVDHAWYAAMGAEPLWRAKLWNTLLLRGLTAALGSVFVFVNLYYVRHSIVSLVLPRRVGDLEIGEEVPGRHLMGAVLLLSVALGALLTIPYGDWTLLAQAWSGLPYGESDPYHQVDVGFYVHWLPFEVALYHWALLSLLVVAVAVVALYALTPSLRWERGTVRVTTYVRRHLVALGTVAMLLLAWSYRLDEYRLLMDGSGAGGAFTYADHRVRLAANAFLAAFTAAVAVLVLLTGWMGQLRRAFGGVSLVLFLSVALRQALPALVTRLGAPTDPVRRERPYELTRATYSRRAMGLELLQPADSLRALTTVGDLARGASAWDARALAVALERRERAGQVVGDAGWTNVGGALRGFVVLRPRDDVGADAAAGAWTLAGAPADAPLAPPVDDDSLAASRPLAPAVVYPGAYGWALVDDPQGRVPSPALRSSLARVAHAWGEQNLRFLDASLGRPTTRLVLRRDVRERLAALAPFFQQGTHVTPVVADGTLFWVVHLYSATEWYPLAALHRVGSSEWRAWRHAAVAVIQAQTGRVTIVPVEDRDALADSWVRRFPRLFADWTALPSALLAQLPPALDAAEAQAATLAATGLRREGAPPRRVLGGAAGDTLVAAEPTPFATASGATAISFPLLDSGDRLAGLVIALGGARSGVAWLPLATPGPRWGEARSRLAVEDTAAAVPVHDGGRTITGGLRAVPLSDGRVALLQSQYRWRGDAAPELRRVAIVAGDTVAAAPTLAQALGLGAPRGTAEPGTLPAGDPRARAAALYDRMRAATRRGDWRAFGEAFDELGRVLGRAPR